MNRGVSLRNSQWWQRLSEGWKELWQRARGALTAFSPAEDQSDLPVTRSATRWGLLPVEVETDPDEVVVRLEAPGLSRDQLDVEVLDDILVIRGEKRAESTRRDGGQIWTERAYGRFERRLALPCAVDSARAKANYRHGVLTLHLPRVEKARRIEVLSR